MKIPADLKYDSNGLIPAVIQDATDSVVLMVAYMNAESVKRTVETGLTWFWSRSRKTFWQKGETSGHVQRVREILLPRDAAGARRLLAEAGYPGGAGFPAFQYLFAGAGSGGGQEHERVAVELKEMWERELGIRVELRRMEKRVFIAAQTGLQYDVSQSKWVGDYNDPNTFLDLFMSSNGNNRTGWKNPRYDALLRSANEEPEAANRSAILRQAEVMLIDEEAPVTPLHHATGFNYYDPQRVTGIYANLLDLHPINAPPGTSRQPRSSPRPR